VTVIGASTFGSLNDFFNSGLWTAISRLAILFVVVFWLAVAFWVYKDARRRVEDSVLVWTAAALGVVLPFVGAIVYMLFRPPEYLEDVRERELEIKAMERRLGGRDLHCPVCRAEVDSSFLVCPVCTTRLRQACTGCGAPLEALWQVCPFCETPIESDGTTVPVEPPRRRRRERS
jgi:hypothetical protein